MNEWHVELPGIKAYEINQVKAVLSYHVGNENAISRKKLLNQTTRLNDRELRLVITHLRRDGVLICSRGGRGGGYWMAKDLNDVQSFINAELRSRAYDMLKTAQRMEHSAIAQFGSQIKFI